MSSSKPEWGGGSGEKAQVYTYQLPEFSEEVHVEYQASTSEFEFLHLGDEAKEAALTLEEAQKLAKEVLAKAKSEAESITAQAEEAAKQTRADAEAIRKEAEAIRAKAKDEGYADGHAAGVPKGREDGLQQFEKDVAPVFTSFENIDQLYENLWMSNEAPLVKLASIIAGRVVLQEISMNPETVGAAFRAVVDMLQDQHEVMFRIHPEDLSYLEEVRGELKERLAGLTKIHFETDDTLSRGDLIMESASGRVDARVKRRLEAVIGTVDETLETAFDLDW